MNWNRVRAIASWEYMQKVRSKGFIISLILTPVIMIGFSVIPGYLASQGPEETEVVGIIDKTGKLVEPLKQQMESSMKLENGQPSYLLSNYLPAGRSADSAIAAADADALSEKIEGTLVLEDSAGTLKVSYRSPNPSNIQLLGKFEGVIERANTELHLRDAGIDTALYARLSQDVDIDVKKVSKRGGTEDGGFLATFIIAYGGSILLMFLIMTTGQTLVRSLVEEKSNRIMELLVGSGTPQELMWGKLIGLSGLGLTQMACWAIVGLGAITTMTLPSSVSAGLLGAYAVVPYIFIYMILGYIFYSAVFIGLGSLVTTEQEAQVITSYLVLLLVVPMAFSIVVLQYPDASYVRALSYVPLFTPSLMMIRIVTKMPPLWEIAATMGVMFVATGCVVWAAGKVFRTAILMYGKRPSFGEIVRWFRTE